MRRKTMLPGLVALSQHHPGRRSSLLPSVLLHDFNGDGFKDLLTVGESKGFLSASAKVFVYLGNDSEVLFSSEGIELGAGVGSLPRLLDVDGDGDMDLVGAEYFHNNSKKVSFAWFEQVSIPDSENPAGIWKRHVIANDLGPSMQLSVIDDLFGDGVLRLVGANHTNTKDDAKSPESQLVVFPEIPADPTELWSYRKISEGIVSRKSPLGAPQGAPGVFGHGYLDGDGDDHIFVLEQTDPGAFATHVMLEAHGQCGVFDIQDIDGDGNAEFAVTSYEENVVYVFSYTP